VQLRLSTELKYLNVCYYAILLPLSLPTYFDSQKPSGNSYSSQGVTKHYKVQTVCRYAFVLQLRITDLTQFTNENEARAKKGRSVRLHNCLTRWSW